MKRCAWSGSDPLYMDYHDQEWGVPLHDDQKLFEMLVLEGMQAGLSWLMVLKRRDSFRQAFKDFDPKTVASFSDKKLETILKDEGVIRNRLKIYSVRQNALAFLKIQQEFASFDHYLWQYVAGKQKQNRWQRMEEVPATSLESDALSKDLKKRGFSFVGSTICYAYMQAVGLVNDHVKDCFRYKEIVSQNRKI